MGKTLLLVDDDPDFLAGLSAFLETKGFQVDTAASAEAGIQAARELRPDLCVLDVKMEGMDGYAMCEALKQDDQTFETPVIFLSGLTETGDVLRGYYAGAHEYLTKPVDQDELLRKIAKLIGT